MTRDVIARSLIELNVDALFTTDLQGLISAIDHHAEELTGRSSDELVGTAFCDYFTEPETVSVAIQRVVQDGKPTSCESKVLARDGTTKVVGCDVAAIREAGQVAGVFARLRDITEQRRIEEALRDQRFYTRSLIEATADALIVTDPAGDVTEVNQQMESLTGYFRNELIGTHLRTHFTEPQRAADGLRAALGAGVLTDYELTARSRAGRETVVSFSASTLYDREGKLLGLLATARDVTERKRFERTLGEKNRELEEANRAKSVFLANMSHELRTPMNAIIGFTGTLLMKFPGPLTDDQEKQLRTINQSSQHLLSLINDLLDMARIESGKLHLAIETLSAHQAAEEAAATLSPLAQGQGLEVRVESRDRDLAVRADRRALNQILLNLVNNAIKFTEKGSVRIAIDGSSHKGKPQVQFSVIDTGIGIRVEDQARLFRPFERLESPLEEREGSGLGLVLSQQLAQRLGGTIHVESEFGCGSTFTLVLPAG
jgi:PAS domain S-box-containing protein